MLELIVHNRGKDTVCIEYMCESDIEYIMKQNFVMIGSDSYQPEKGALCHPRTYGTFTRIYAEYVKNRGILKLEDAVRKMTSLPAQRLGLKTKGIIREGMDADIVVFDYDSLKDCADKKNPLLKSQGMKYVFVNGEMAVDNGKYTGILAGKVLRKS